MNDPFQQKEPSVESWIKQQFDNNNNDTDINNSKSGKSRTDKLIG